MEKKKPTYFHAVWKSLLLIVILLNGTGLIAYAEGPVLPNEANRGNKKGIAVDAKTGEVIFSQGGDVEDYPASMTKVLTAILVDERMKDNETLTVSANAANQEPSKLGIIAGEKLTKEQALHALMIKSANDVSVAVAEHIGGSAEGFAKLMNEKAKELGAKEANFVTANGLHHSTHKISPYEMALITMDAMKRPAIMKAMSAKSYTVKTDKQTVELQRNDRIFSIDHAIAGKTGYTSEAGNTLVVIHQEGNKKIVTVIMQATKGTQYEQSEQMAKYAFSQMTEVPVVKLQEKVGTHEINGKVVTLEAKEGFTLERIKNRDPKVRREKVFLPKEKLEKLFRIKETDGKTIKTLPKGTQIAVMKVYTGNNPTPIKEIPLLTKEPLQIVEEHLKKEEKNVLIVGAPLAVLFLLVVINRRKNKQKLKKNQGTKVYQNLDRSGEKLVYRQSSNKQRPFGQ